VKKEENREGGADACRRMFESAAKENWEEAYSAYYDMHVICDDQLEEEEGEEEPEEGGADKPKGKRPLAAIIIGGPAKK
jgi:hypothetical protein